MKMIILLCLVGSALVAQSTSTLPARIVLESAGNYTWQRGGQKGVFTLNLTPDGTVDEKPAKWGFHEQQVKVEWAEGNWIKFPAAAGTQELDGTSNEGPVKVKRTTWNAAGVRLEAQSFGGKTVRGDWLWPWGSYVRSTSTRGILFTITTVGRVPSVVHLEWAWVSRNNGVKKVTKGGEEKVIVKQGGSTKFFTPEGIFSEIRSSYWALGDYYRSGDKYVGWMGRLLDEKGKIVSTVMSSPGMDATGNWESAQRF